MFITDDNIPYLNIESPKIQDESVNGIKYSIKPMSYAGEKSGCALVSQYLGTMFNKLGYSARMRQDQIDEIYQNALILDKSNGKDEDPFPTMKSALQTCLDSGYIRNADLVFFNDVKTLKWYMHEYKNLIVQLKLTNTTKNAHRFQIDSSGDMLFDGKYSKGFIVMQYDGNGLILQNSLGENVGARGFNRISWETFNDLFIDGATFTIKG